MGTQEIRIETQEMCTRAVDDNPSAIKHVHHQYKLNNCVIKIFLDFAVFQNYIIIIISEK